MMLRLHRVFTLCLFSLAPHLASGADPICTVSIGGYSVPGDRKEFCQVMRDPELQKFRESVVAHSPMANWNEDIEDFATTRLKLAGLARQLVEVAEPTGESPDAVHDAQVLEIKSREFWYPQAPTGQCLYDGPARKLKSFQTVTLHIQGRNEGNLTVDLLNFPIMRLNNQALELVTARTSARVVWLLHGHHGSAEILTGEVIDHDFPEGRPLERCLAGKLASRGYQVLTYTDPTEDDAHKTAGADGFKRVLQDALAVQAKLLLPLRFKLDLAGISGGAQRLYFLLPILKNVNSAYFAGYFSSTWMEPYAASVGDKCHRYDLCYDTDFVGASITENYLPADLLALALADGVKIAFASNAREGARAHKAFLQHELLPLLSKLHKPFELAGDDLRALGPKPNQLGLCHEWDVADYEEFLQSVRSGDPAAWPRPGHQAPTLKDDSLPRRKSPIDAYCGIDPSRSGSASEVHPVR
jgi:hypothetical protein